MATDTKNNKELFTRRFYKPLLDAVRKVKERDKINHTTFIEQAIDEKLQREGYTDKSLLLNDVNNTWAILFFIEESIE